MAGNDEVGTGWGKSYDDAISDYILQVCRLADAFGAIASRSYTAGLNHLNAEFVAGGKQGAHPTPPSKPTAVDQRVPFAAPPSAVGDNGPGLNTDIPGLLGAIGVAVPNASPTKLAAAGEALNALHSIIKDKSDDVLSAASTPPPDAGPDAALLHEEILTNLIAPAGRLHEDGVTQRDRLGDQQSRGAGRDHADCGCARDAGHRGSLGCRRGGVDHGADRGDRPADLLRDPSPQR